MSPTLTALLKKTYTKNDLHRRLRLMQECLETVVYDEPEQIRITPAHVRRERFIKEKAQAEDAAVLFDLDSTIWEGFNAKNLVSSIKALQSEIEQLPVITLYVPVHFTDVQLAPIGEWARSNVASGMLFEVEVEPSVVGGCSFVYNGRHFDWSLRRYLRAQRGLVTSLLNAYGE